MAPSRDYYDILGIKKDASADEVKKAFRRLARKHHPDAGGDEEKFKEINEAYEVLSDAEKRAQYDQYGQYYGGMPPGGAPGAGGWPGGVHVDVGDLGDLFGDLFGGATRGRPRGPQPRRGSDVQVQLDVTFAQAFEGTSAVVEIDRTETCGTCSGSGAKPGTAPVTCPVCKGTGQVAQGQGVFGFSRPCGKCGGTGSVVEQPCTTCRGAGQVRRRVPVTVNVPAGATDGGKLRFKGKGESGAAGGPAGDLYVVTRISPHPFYRREGADVVIDLPVSFAEAALGTSIKVPAPGGGGVKLRVPAGTQSGTVLRVRGKGAPKLKGAGSGDLLVKVRVVVPESVTDAQRDALATFEGEGERLRTHIT